MHLNSLLLFDKYLASCFTKESRVLEIGPDDLPSSYRKRIKEVAVWDTLEVDKDGKGKTTFVSTELYRYPIADASYDIILSGQVMEHVAEIWTWLSELKRIVKPGGVILLITPTSWPYHEAPIDCWRIYPEGMKSLAAYIKLEVRQLVWESAEREVLRDLKNLKLIEGRSCFHDTTIRGLRKVNFYNGMIRNLPIVKNLQVTTETAFDMITILEKN